MDEQIIAVDHITKQFGAENTRVTAIDDMTLKVFKGEFVIVFGPSGSGKSTLLNIVAGLDNVTNGTVKIDGVELSTLSSDEKAKFHREKIGIVFQAYNLVPTFTVEQNISLPLVFAGVKPDERVSRAQKLLKDFNLATLEKRLPAEVSGGQQQRVGIMRALVTNPPILIADEPTGNLDSVTSKEVMELFRDLNQRLGVTVLVVTHDPTQFQWADRVVHVLDGKIIKQTVYHDKVYYSTIEDEGQFEYVTAKEHGEIVAAGGQTGVGEALEEEEKEEEEPQEKIDKVIAFDALWLKREQLDSQIVKTLGLLPVIMDKEHLDALKEEEVLSLAQSLKLRTINKLTYAQLLDFLDRPKKKGGIGLYKQVAERIANEVEELINLFGYQRETKKKQPSENTPPEMSEFESLWLERQHLTEEEQIILELISYWLSDYQIKHFTKDQLNSLLGATRMRINHQLSDEEFFDVLDDKEGVDGVGLYSQTARYLSDEVGAMLRLFSYEEKGEKVADKPKELSGFDILWSNKMHLDIVSERVLEALDGLLSDEQKHRMTEEELRSIVQAVKYRIENKLTSEEFFDYLDSPERVGGVGLYKQTAMKLSRQIDNIKRLFNE
ncbi:ABC transporter ATP-binding protein [candidate division WWE3 bacterium]|uniref:ABC transporter ATP-binding protein n=1 Tax=candidate division WWE3 bacterium TaxID=2053526 RepID=A0A955RQK2_UNCKA|nr:ABC transporter ATP-binding protein [candidate division WWE3 bacterium]